MKIKYTPFFCKNSFYKNHEAQFLKCFKNQKSKNHSKDHVARVHYKAPFDISG